MIQIRIGTDQRPLNEADAAWITQQVNNRKDEG